MPDDQQERREGFRNVENIVRTAVKESVHETLTTLGFDTKNPTETQKDVAHMRRTRKGSELISGIIQKTFITSCVGGALILLWEGFKTKIGN